MKIAVIDNKMGNIRSVTNALNFLSVDYFVASTPEDLKGAAGIILPGVGSFKAAALRLKENKFDVELLSHINNNKPLLGICLGMQLLFEFGEEGGGAQGLGFLPGKVTDLSHKIEDLSLPHIGWNDLTVYSKSLFKDITSDDCVYFVHGYEVETEKRYISATTHYGKEIVAAVEKDHIYGVQFHPEKSQKEGLDILKHFADICLDIE